MIDVSSASSNALVMALLSTGSWMALPMVMTTAPTNSHGQPCRFHTMAPAMISTAATISTISGGPDGGSALVYDRAPNSSRATISSPRSSRKYSRMVSATAAPMDATWNQAACAHPNPARRSACRAHATSSGVTSAWIQKRARLRSSRPGPSPIQPPTPMIRLS